MTHDLSLQAEHERTLAAYLAATTQLSFGTFASSPFRSNSPYSDAYDN